MTGIDFKENWNLVCRRYVDKYKKSLRVQYCETFHTLSAIVYDKFFVPFCAMLFMHLEKLMRGKFIDDSKAFRMLQFCIQGLSANGHSIKIDFEHMFDWSWNPETVQENVYLGNSNKFTRSRRKEVLTWAQTLYLQLEERRQLRQKLV